MYKACNSDKPLTIYIVMYANSNEEERYLCSLRKEQIAFEDMVREQGVCLVVIIFFETYLKVKFCILNHFQTLMFAREYETDRKEPHRLILVRSTRDAGGRADQNEGSPKVIFF